MSDNIDRDLQAMLADDQRRANVRADVQPIRDAAAEQAGLALAALIETTLAEYPKLADLYAADRLHFLLTIDDIGPSLILMAVTPDGRGIPIFQRKAR